LKPTSPFDQQKTGNNAFTTPGTATVSALFPRTVSESSDALLPVSRSFYGDSESAVSEFPVSRSFYGDSGSAVSESFSFETVGSASASKVLDSKVLDGARCPHRKSWKRLRAKKGCAFFVCFQCGAKWRTRGNMDTEEEIFEDA
jgi:hypothetical protein